MRNKRWYILLVSLIILIGDYFIFARQDINIVTKLPLFYRWNGWTIFFSILGVWWAKTITERYSEEVPDDVKAIMQNLSKDQKIYRGDIGDLIITDNSVLIKRGEKGIVAYHRFALKDRIIPFSDIASVRLKKGHFIVAGYIYFVLKNHGLRWWQRPIFYERYICFHPSKNMEFEEAKRIIESHITNSNPK